MKLIHNEDEDVEEKLTVNKEYAARFVHNKKREDLHRLQELEKKGMVDTSDSSSEEEDEDGVLPARLDAEIFETLVKIKKQDPSIYVEESRFYEDVEDEEEIDVGRDKKGKPLYLKDVNARQLLEGGGEIGEESLLRPKAPVNYAKEQDELKRAFLQSVAEVDSSFGNEGFLKVKKKTKEELEKEKEEEVEAIAEAEQRQKDKVVARKLEDYFGKDEDLDDNDRFLKDYLLNNGWIDNDRRSQWRQTDVEEDISEDEEALDKQDEFEADYNFRFQEQGSTQVLGHSRTIDSSVRKKLERRKKQRQNKKQRLADVESARHEELKRMKNLKKKDILDKLNKIRTVAGIAESSSATMLQEDDLEEDFNPEEYDRKMKQAFGESYYGAEDLSISHVDSDKPDFGAEDELLGMAEGTSGTRGFRAAYENNRKRSWDKVPLKEKLLFDEQFEEYYKLDYEDMISDLPTRFKYRQVKPNKYGLETKKLLSAEDKDLNQYVSLKRLATYNTQEWKPWRRFHVKTLKKKKEKSQ